MRKARRQALEDDGSPSLWRLNQQVSAKASRRGGTQTSIETSTSRDIETGSSEQTAVGQPRARREQDAGIQEVKAQEGDDESEEDQKPSAQELIAANTGGAYQFAANSPAGTHLAADAFGDDRWSSSTESGDSPPDIMYASSLPHCVASGRPGVAAVASLSESERRQAGAFAVAGPGAAFQDIHSWQNTATEEDTEEEKSSRNSSDSSPSLIEAQVVDHDDRSATIRRLEDQLDNAVQAEVIPVPDTATPEERKFLSTRVPKLYAC